MNYTSTTDVTHINAHSSLLTTISYTDTCRKNTRNIEICAVLLSSFKPGAEWTERKGAAEDGLIHSLSANISLTHTLLYCIPQISWMDCLIKNSTSCIRLFCQLWFICVWQLWILARLRRISPITPRAIPSSHHEKIMIKVEAGYLQLWRLETTPWAGADWWSWCSRVPVWSHPVWGSPVQLAAWNPFPIHSS